MPVNVDNIHLMAYWEAIHFARAHFQVCRFCGLVCGTCKVFKIRAKVVLKIVWLVKTP